MDSPPRRPPPLPQLVIELRDLVVTYVKQQTLVPLKQLGRYVGFGLLGSLLLGFGVVFLALSGLRALQTETNGTFSDDWSWVPYVIMVVALVLGGALVWVLRSGSRTEREEAR
jgi:Sec-independent protein secretion pathway component TatC